MITVSRCNTRSQNYLSKFRTPRFVAKDCKVYVFDFQVSYSNNKLKLESL